MSLIKFIARDSLERRFLFPELLKHISFAYFAKINDGKIANFHQNHGLTLLEKSPFINY